MKLEPTGMDREAAHENGQKRAQTAKEQTTTSSFTGSFQFASSNEYEIYCSNLNFIEFNRSSFVLIVICGIIVVWLFSFLLHFFHFIFLLFRVSFLACNEFVKTDLIKHFEIIIYYYSGTLIVLLKWSGSQRA